MRAHYSGIVRASLLGLDVGSTTVKVAIVDRVGDAPLHTQYARHRGDPIVAIREQLESIALRCDRVVPFVTGSNAHAIAQCWDAPHIHEVSAVGEAVAQRNAEVGAVIELGGQDAKLISRAAAGDHIAMNDRCAAGTGVTIDRCLQRLGIAPEDAARVEFDARLLRLVSTKCGVFAETDLINLARSGVPAPDLVISLADAIVVQNLALLSRGVTLAGPVALLGGPHAYFPALAGAWRHRLKVDRVFVPKHALFYAAIGACELGLRRAPDRAASTVRELWSRLGDAGDANPQLRLDEPLRDREIRAASPRRRAGIHRALGELTVGIDAGSTTSKAVAIDDHGAVVARAQCASREPVTDARRLLADLESHVSSNGTRFEIGHLGVTGYGAPVLGKVLDADVEVVETVAHSRAARTARPDVDVICDVGGQDIKVIRLDRDGHIRDFWLSSQCTAGIGAVLESVAHDFGIAIDDFADRAMAADRTPWFGDACVVFLDSNRITFQRYGFTPDEILAGLARVVPRIVWSHVTNAPTPAALGTRFVLQGGVHRNRAVVQAQLDFLRRHVPEVDVTIHPEPEVAGALGAALLAAETTERRAPHTTAHLTEARISVRNDEDTRCSVCASRCPRTFVDVRAPGRPAAHIVTGFGCEQGATVASRSTARRRRARDPKRAVPDLIAEENRLLFSRPKVPRLHEPPRPLRLGIPRVLAMYRGAPLFRAYLESLGAKVVFSPSTHEKMWLEGAGHGASDPCFPVKVVLAHVHHLVDRVHDRGRPLDAIVAPYFTHAVTPVTGVADSASCVVVTAVPALIRSAFAAPGGELDRRGIRLLDPMVTVTRKPLLQQQMFDGFGTLLGVTRAISDEAVEVALGASRRVTERLLARGRSVLQGVDDGRWPSAVVFVARPYHADPGLNHRLGTELRALGLPVLTIASLPRDGNCNIAGVLPGCANSGAAERVWAARFAARHGRLAVVDLSSFKCGQDSPTYGPIKEILERHGVVTCALHDLDETRPVTSLRVRLRTFAHALSERGMA